MNGHSRDFNSNFAASIAANFARQTDNTALVATVTRSHEDSSTLLLCFGTIADADATFTLLVEDSDDNVTYATASANDYQGTLTGVDFADDNTVHPFTYWGRKKYWRLTATPANNTGNLDWGIVKLVGNTRVQP